MTNTTTTDRDLVLYWNELIDSVEKTIRDLDNALLTLSSASLVLSATFAANIGKKSAHLAQTAWFWLLLAIGLVLFGWIISALGTSFAARTVSGNKLPSKRFRFWWNAPIWAITIVSAGSFITGLVFLGRFAIKNLAGA